MIKLNLPELTATRLVFTQVGCPWGRGVGVEWLVTDRSQRLGAVEHWYSGEHVMAATVTPLTSGRHACTDPGTRPGDKDQGLDLEATQRSPTGPGHWATIGSS